ncbi:hypothetical protein ZHAS_00019445 [Anopheles sinensis]|uniref:Uncharacterized protein n=1 Tax=Anopheles sinensis TaxID=74873 RepID=A0A084WLU0_ANOSI|nr:hypothetical protein ZHAS_00019445 [Anopheles sinensis]
MIVKKPEAVPNEHHKKPGEYYCHRTGTLLGAFEAPGTETSGQNSDILGRNRRGRTLSKVFFGGELKRHLEKEQ